MLKRILILIAAMLTVCCMSANAEGLDVEWSIEDEVIILDDGEIIPDPNATPIITPMVSEAPVDKSGEQVLTPREDMIERIIALGKKLYVKADGHPQRAHYSGDIYVCKNFTTYLFRQNRDDFRMAEFPKTTLVIPNNMPTKKCKPYKYGLMWEDIPAEKGNPFYAAAEFRYDSKLSKEENMNLAVAFMHEVQRGDYFQMSADYYYGVGAHSAIMISDYDPVTNTVHWMDSNMRGTKKNGERYGYVQFDEVKDVEWWAEAFCHKGRGATLYRLRDDIVYASEVK